MVSKLQVGDIVKVEGFVMLRGVNDGAVLRVCQVGKAHGLDTYTFCRPRGRRAVAAHYADSVDMWVKPASHPDLNKIILVERVER